MNKKQKKKAIEYSKRIIHDTRPLLWIVTIGGMLLAFFAVWSGYVGSLPWIGSMVGLPWASHGIICSFYLRMAESDHKEGGITFEAAKANNFEKYKNNIYEDGQI